MFNEYKQVLGSSKQLMVARVKKIILGPKMTDSQPDPDYTCEKDVGAITYEIMYSGKMNVTGLAKRIKLAYPMFGFIRQYPLVGEFVLMVAGPSANLNDSSQNQDLFYFPPFSVFNSAHINAFPNLQEYAEYIKSQLASSITDSPEEEYFTLPVGSTFVEKKYIKSLRPFEGDTILQGRWGQSIRLGSTITGLKSLNHWSSGKTDDNTTSGDPITIIANSQKTPETNIDKEAPAFVENINRDGSYIYMTSTQNVLLDDINNFEIRSWRLSTSVDPLVDTVVTTEQTPISNDFKSAAEQDAKSVSGNFYVYGPNGEILEERDSQGNLVRKF